MVNGPNVQGDPFAQAPEIARGPEVSVDTPRKSGDPDERLATSRESSQVRSNPGSTEGSVVAFLRESALRNDAHQAETEKPASEAPVSDTAAEFVRRSAWQRVAVPVLFVLFLSLSAFGLYLILPTLRSKPTGHPIEASAPGLKLQIARAADGQVNLNWNRDDPDLLKAKGGELAISEGKRFYKLKLDNAQLRLGKLLYTPKGPDVQFRLELFVDDQRTVAESVRTLPAPEKANRAKLSSSEHQNRPPAVSESGRELKLGKAPRRDTDVATPGESGPKLPVSTSRTASQVSATRPPASLHAAAAANKPPAPPSKTYVPPRVLDEVMPETMPHGQSAEVSVRVSVDPDGRVTHARALNAEAVNDTSLTASALSAARQWRFKPATLNSEPVPADYTIVFAFRAQPR